MNPAPIDHQRAKRNPWGLTAHQCMTLRLVCEHGGSKRTAYERKDISARLLEHHLLQARRAMGLFGMDVRLFLEWDRWVRKA